MLWPGLFLAFTERNKKKAFKHKKRLLLTINRMNVNRTLKMFHDKIQISINIGILHI